MLDTKRELAAIAGLSHDTIQRAEVKLRAERRAGEVLAGLFGKEEQAQTARDQEESFATPSLSAN